MYISYKCHKVYSFWPWPIHLWNSISSWLNEVSPAFEHQCYWTITSKAKRWEKKRSADMTTTTIYFWFLINSCMSIPLVNRMTYDSILSILTLVHAEWTTDTPLQESCLLNIHSPIHIPFAVAFHFAWKIFHNSHIIGIDKKNIPYSFSAFHILRKWEFDFVR